MMIDRFDSISKKPISFVYPFDLGAEKNTNHFP